MFPGIKVKLADSELIIPALSLGQLRSGVLDLMKKHDDVVSSGDLFSAMTIRGQIITIAAQRNYPDVTEDQIMAGLDLSNTTEIWNSILGLSGFKPKEDGLGEATAAEKSGA